MPQYKYKAINEKGETIESTSTATDRAMVLQMIRDRKYHPVSVEEVVERKDTIHINLFNHVSMKDLAVFCRQFYTMLNSGVTIIKCLDILQQQTEKKKLRFAIRDVYESVQKGATLSEGLRKQREVFPELLYNMVEAGEVGGSLDTVMNRMAIHFEKESKIRNKVKATMVYPIVLSFITIAVVVFMVVVVMPTFIGMFESSNTVLPLPTRMMLGLSNAIKGYWYFIFLGIFLLVYIVRKYLKSDKGRLAWDKLKIRLPIIRGTVIKLNVTRFTRTLATLLTSGIRLMQALDVVAKVVGNKVVTNAIFSAREDMRRGMDLATTIRRIGIFPPMVDSMIRVGEESGTLDEILDRTADFYDDEVEVALQRMVSLLEPIMIIIMALIIGFIVISIAMPLFDIINTVQ